MHLVARLGKAQTHRLLPETCRRLRRLTAYYDEDEVVRTATRQRIQAVIEDLFPDYDKSATFTFGSTGQALLEAYAFNPYHIVRAGYGRFKNVVKRRVNARFATLEHLFDCAEQSIRYAKTETEVEVLVERLRQLWADYECGPTTSGSRLAASGCESRSTRSAPNSKPAATCPNSAI